MNQSNPVRTRYSQDVGFIHDVLGLKFCAMMMLR